MAYLDHIRACNTWNPDDFVPLLWAGQRIGSLRRDHLAQLTPWPEFVIDDAAVTWAGAAADFDGRTRQLAVIVERLIAKGAISHHHGEQYAVTAGGREQAIALIDRTSVPFFGMRAFGQHLNGYTRIDGRIEMWLGRRAADRHHFPGHLDQMVAGGLPWTLSLAGNLRKECAEEAGIAPALADRALPVGAVTYCQAIAAGLKPDTIYCYDLEVPPDFVPHCTDGEVAEFIRLPVAEVAALVRDTTEIKRNCNLVIIDFLIRHGVIGPEAPDYSALIAGLHAPLPGA